MPSRTARGREPEPLEEILDCLAYVHAVHAGVEDAAADHDHGSPGSVLELVKVIGPLTDPRAHGNANDAFHLALPSMQGYGFRLGRRAPARFRAVCGAGRGRKGARIRQSRIDQTGCGQGCQGGYRCPIRYPSGVATEPLAAARKPGQGPGGIRSTGSVTRRDVEPDGEPGSELCRCGGLRSQQASRPYRAECGCSTAGRVTVRGRRTSRC